jgi:hypothetical protein
MALGRATQTQPTATRSPAERSDAGTPATLDNAPRPVPGNTAPGVGPMALGRATQTQPHRHP